MKTRKILAFIIMAALMGLLVVMPAMAAKDVLLEEDFSDAAVVDNFSPQDEIGVEYSTRFDRKGVRFFFSEANPDIWPQANRWVGDFAGKVYVEIDFLVGELADGVKIIQLPCDPGWWPYMGVVTLSADGKLVIGESEHGDVIDVPGGGAIKAETWYSLTVLVDFESLNMTAWVGSRPADVQFVKLPRDNAEVVKSIGVQVPNAGFKGIYYSKLVAGNYSSLDDFPAAGGVSEDDLGGPSTSVGAAKTGDSAFIGLALALLALSGAGFVVLRKKA